MQYAVAKAAMRFIAEQSSRGYLDHIGITEEDYRFVSASDQPWQQKDRNRVTHILNCLMSSTLDAQGIPRMDKIPAEYLAANIVVHVGPLNSLAACRFMEMGVPAQDLGRGVDSMEQCTARQIFALVIQLYADPAASLAKITFEKKLGRQIQEAEKQMLTQAKEKERSRNG